MQAKLGATVPIILVSGQGGLVSFIQKNSVQGWQREGGFPAPYSSGHLLNLPVQMQNLLIFAYEQ